MQKDMVWFDKFIADIKNQSFYKEPFAWGFGRINKGILNSNKILSVDYEILNFKENFTSAAILMWVLNEYGVKFNGTEVVVELTKEITTKALSIFEPLKNEIEKHKNFKILVFIDKLLDDPKSKFCVVFMFEDIKPKSIESAYLALNLHILEKLNLKSQLDEIFKILNQNNK